MTYFAQSRYAVSSREGTDVIVRARNDPQPFSFHVDFCPVLDVRDVTPRRSCNDVDSQDNTFYDVEDSGPEDVNLVSLQGT